MLKEFIKEYKNAYQINFDEGFKGDLDRFKLNLTEPKFHPSAELISAINSLEALHHSALTIAIVGQFSSGKSSFLNALINSDILPTGVVPVTAKPTYIKYAPFEILQVCFNDDAKVYYPISDLRAFVDQRIPIKDVKYLTIYTNSEILKKVSFIDTPGLNSRSDNDTQETQKVLKHAHALIWISLIDNAARQSELNELTLIPKHLKTQSICLLNQKDKLSQDEISNVMNHAQNTYKEFFSKVSAISSKMQLENNKNSGFDEVFNFIDFLANNKTHFIKQECNYIVKTSIAQNEKFVEILNELRNILVDFNIVSAKALESCTQKYKNRFKILFDFIKQSADGIANEIATFLLQEKKVYYKQKEGMFNKNNYMKVEYERVVLKCDDALSKLIFNDNKIKNIFNDFKKELNTLQKDIKNEINNIYFDLHHKVLEFKAKYETLRRKNELHSPILFAYIRKFSSEVYALFLHDYEKAINEVFTNLDLFMDKINIKIATNYENAIRLSVSFIDNKINKFASNYEQSPSTFALYIPSLKDINERVLLELSYYEFENDFIGNYPFAQSIFNDLKKHFSHNKDCNIKYIDALKEKYEQYIEDIKSNIFN